MDESISQLEKYGNSSKVTDFDLLKYEVNQANEKIKANPEFRKTYNEMAKAIKPFLNCPIPDVLLQNKQSIVYYETFTTNKVPNLLAFQSA